MFNYLIPVTQDHIDNSRCGDEYNCAIAKGLDDAIVGSEPFVSGHFITIWIEGHGRQNYGTTEALGSWISKFDHDKTRVNPIVVKLMRASNGFWADILEQQEEA